MLTNILVKLFGFIYHLFKPFVKTKLVYKYKKLVWANPLIEKIRKDDCLCFSCERFDIKDRSKNCPIANATYDNCVKYDTATPVTRCPIYLQIGK